ncbi:succinate dehydrogenase, hydrophobic membrane anchor protein [Methyloraptor flagellatus]|jgi:succinate dehydrogenase / fumarate reductase membrane anchor subunit|uniref:Succinate dehydrogenase hydrophobic membrane anchor subunit n=1 Tax=Methyloraptor flagellatus TaxID=3162530 RepID=A0AAU7X8Q7_9HYPH
MTDMRTPLSRVRGLGSAKDGTEHFWLQRLTALALIPLALFLVILVLSIAHAGSPAEARAVLGSPFSAILLAASIVAGAVHMQLGMRVIIEDYVHTEGLKALALMANSFFAAIVGIASIWAVAKLSFGM